jgi:3',5'-cyclic AMP phosphodiesterase CpdA
VVQTHKNHFLYVLQRTELSGHQICQRLDYCETPVDFDLFKVASGDDDDDADSDSTLSSIIETGSWRVAHLSDIHLDLDYVPGSEADCGDIVCCHQQPKEHQNVTRPAGKYGDFKCDIPRATVASLLNHIATQNVDMILFTGDMAAHDVWNESRAKAMLTEGALATMLRSTGQPVFPVVGNHETVPANSFPYGNLTGAYTSKWLYSSLALQWLPFLDEGGSKEFVSHGPYSTNHKDYCVIGMNSNVGYLFNVWRLMYYPDPDPDGHLAWLQRQLEKCKQSGKMIILIGHHPPGDRDFSKQWTRQYSNIVKGYRDTIVLALFGHTHLDSFRLFNDSQHVAIITPSVATWTDTRPAYRVFNINGSNMHIEHKTFLMDLDTGSFAEEYTFKCATSTFTCYRDYMERIRANNSVAQQEFFMHHFKSSQERVDNCTAKCRKDILDGLLY